MIGLYWQTFLQFLAPDIGNYTFCRVSRYVDEGLRRSAIEQVLETH